jgi:hypothetical protein
MKSLCITLLVFFLFVLPSYSENLPNDTPPQDDKVISKAEPLSCPHCGVWQDEWFGIFVIDEKRIIIPGCGIFEYDDVDISSDVRHERINHHNYKITMRLKQQKTSFLCDNGDDKIWYLQADISGHFQEGGTGSFKISNWRSGEPVKIWLGGWNIDREDPCDAGSGRGTASCFRIETSHVYNALARAVESAYQLLTNIKTKKLPDFNVARFSVVVDKFCAERERESGGGSWPAAHAFSCQHEIMKKKYDEFVSWRSCVEKNQNKLKLCRFPSERFNRNIECPSEE